MRTIKKELKVTVKECLVYDVVEKIEKKVDIIVTPLNKDIPLPENCVMIEEKTIEEKELVYTMSPETFVKHATVEEKKKEA